VTHLRKLMLEELQRRNYSQTTVTGYIRTVADFAKYFQRPPDQLGPDEIRTYQLHLLKDRKQGPRTVGTQTAALRFFFCRHGKRNRDRDVPLSPKLLETLREYWRWMQPKTYLFPGTVNGWRADKPITPKVLWEACREAAQTAGITKDVRPHLLRHSYATHLLENGADLPTVQLLLGHSDLKATSIYLHLSERHLKAAGTPIDKAEFSEPKQVKRSRRLHKR
jgi:site-specific recombinase XerD